MLKKLNMENVKEKMSTAWEVTKEQVKKFGDLNADKTNIHEV